MVEPNEQIDAGINPSSSADFSEMVSNGHLTHILNCNLVEWTEIVNGLNATIDAACAQTPLEISQIVFILFLIGSEVVHKR
jgi:hypothetical protein